tara:strand:+ start:879 stop:1574 length:696 start_codon:yes stop_codon:yes gene_type:complete
MMNLLINHSIIDKITKVEPWSPDYFGEFPSRSFDDAEECSKKCVRRNLLYQMKEIDMEASREYHKKYPPKVGNEVVVFNTMAGFWHKQHKRISAITDRGRLIVKQNLCYYAGISFWKSGQNCKAPTGQTWLVPIELYEVKILNHEFDCKNICNFKKYLRKENKIIEREKRFTADRYERKKLSLGSVRSVQIETRRKRLSLGGKRLSLGGLTEKEKEARLKVLKQGLQDLDN